MTRVEQTTKMKPRRRVGRQRVGHRTTKCRGSEIAMPSRWADMVKIPLPPQSIRTLSMSSIGAAQAARGSLGQHLRGAESDATSSHLMDMRRRWPLKSAPARPSRPSCGRAEVPMIDDHDDIEDAREPSLNALLVSIVTLSEGLEKAFDQRLRSQRRGI